MTLLALVALLQASPSPGGTDSWPGWRGPNGSGVASGSPPIEWSEQENLRWKAPIPGKGLSSPVVWGGRVFLTSAIGTGKKAEVKPSEAGGEPDRRRSPGQGGGGQGGGGEGGRGEGGERGQDRRGDGPPQDGGRERGPGGFGRGESLEEQDFVVFALDRKTGAVQWQKKISTAMPHQGTHRDGSYASPTPVTDGERLFVSFGSYGIYALDFAGTVLWSVDLGDMDITNGFGEGSSPILCGELLILDWDHQGDSFLVALDKATGKERWRTARDSGTNWSTPLVVTMGNSRQLLLAGTVTIAYDPATGKELWREGESVGGGRGGGSIASAVVLDGLVVFATGGRRGGEARAWTLETPKAGEKPAPLLWKKTIDGPHVPSPLAYDGNVYLLKQDSGMLSVLDPTSGEVRYGPERLDEVTDVYASLVAANGHLYVAGRDGTVEVLTTWPEIATVAVNKLEDGIDASPAIAGDELFLRGQGHLYCIAK